MRSADATLRADGHDWWLGASARRGATMTVPGEMVGSRPLVAEPPVGPDALRMNRSGHYLEAGIGSVVQPVECAPVNLIRYVSAH